MPLSAEQKQTITTEALPMLLRARVRDLTGRHATATAERDALVASHAAAVEAYNAEPTNTKLRGEAKTAHSQVKAKGEEIQAIAEELQDVQKPAGIFSLLLENLDTLTDEAACAAYCSGEARRVAEQDLADAQKAAADAQAALDALA